ncbi:MULTISPECIES: GNAT family N-acetyltransferase [unclassified Pseudomonas]|uniref:GNAT family N-acetyltransferase n=1 Tax=unclassified Pseudomonas TaxID=196821 RepID=UPI002AC98188|nr:MULTISPECIES: GNAT family N-acetyltransferase [unclassified Pseudomonas]MEB0046793.1 GNAT family N-acetyltransferase [Pseudomonas sp. Dout3]MEB0097599.1 GNAT family N-acetyltransferase [Pseudomonas sp. DC1.2]WPX61248.1 GNAT family N-acetyltransferase [Pseudomonas sp. DC1.2]
MSTLLFRPFKASDAKTVSSLFRQVYGDHYVLPDVYLPALITQHNSDGRWQSMLAVDGSRVVGHAALCRHTLHPEHAELALSVVHHDSQGQGIATRLGHELIEQAAPAARQLLIKQVTQHPYTQRMAESLGFHCTGLLPDYVPSPFAEPWAESIVIGVHLRNGYTRPLPDVAWPRSCRAFMRHLCSVFGTTREAPWGPIPSLQMKQHHKRVDVIIGRLTLDFLQQLIQLPEDWLISVRLTLSRGFARDLHAMSAKGFTFTGVIPAPGQVHWFALFHRGAQARPLNLHCAHMQQLQDNLTFATAPLVGGGASHLRP